MAIRIRGKAARLATVPLLCTLLGCPQGGVIIDETSPGTTLGSAFFPDEGENVIVGDVRFLWVARDSSESTIRISKDDNPDFVIQRTIPAIPGAEEYVELIQITQPGGYSWVLEIQNATGGLTTGLPRHFTVLICNSGTMCEEQDGVFCNGAEVCVAGFCLPGALPNCSDAIDCTQDVCDAATDACIHTPDNGLCDDNLFCNGLEACDPINDCQPGISPDCDDHIPCTVDSCDEVNDTCLHTPINTACDDGVFCNGAEVCDSLQGCHPGSQPTCDDGVGCTQDSCNQATNACSHIPDHAVCDNGFVCDGTESCDPAFGCRPGSSLNCDDGLVCTADTCDNSGCVHSPIRCSQSSECPGFDPGCDGNSCIFCNEVFCVCPDTLPDLVVAVDLGSIDSICPGGAGTCVATADVTVRNVGSVGAGAFDLRVVFDSGTVIQSVPGLAAGASATFAVSTLPGNSCFDPNCTVCATADINQTVLESDEQNNQDCETLDG